MPYLDKKKKVENNKKLRLLKKIHQKSEVPKSEVPDFELMYDYNQLSNYLSLTKFRHSQLWMIKQRQICADLKTKYGFKMWLFRFKKVMKHFKSLSEYPKWRYEIKECLTELKQYITDKNVKKKVNYYKKMCCGLFV